MDSLSCKLCMKIMFLCNENRFSGFYVWVNGYGLQLDINYMILNWIVRKLKLVFKLFVLVDKVDGFNG